MAVVVAWAMCLAIALGRVEPLCVALPLLMRLMWSQRNAGVDVRALDSTVEPGPRIEGEPLAITINAVVEPPIGPVEILPILPALLTPSRASVRLPQPDGTLGCELASACRVAGILDFGVVYFRVWDPSGLWVAEVRKEHRVTIPVYPRAIVVRTLPAPRQPGVPFGFHLSRRVGGGTDFADIRPFVPGDRMRRINWAVSARTGRLYVNQFFADRSATVILLLDSFGGIGGRPNSSLDHCLRAAAGLAMAYLRHHDRVGLMVFGGLLRWTKPGAGPVQYTNILQSLARVAIAPSYLLEDPATLPETMLPRHALVIALTPLLDERFVQTVVRLADRGHDIVLLALRSDELSQAYAPRRANDPLVRRLWLLERDARLRELRGHGVRAAHWSPSLPIDTALQAVSRLAVGRHAA
jgi:uncharacterized protein (DUF58 family)